MSASAEMPYFIKPSIQLTGTQKEEAYQLLLSEYKALCTDGDSQMVKMVTINCLLKTRIPYAYWAGFYIWNGERLEVGPYQGTLGCLTIELDKGVCGKAARTKETQIVKDCHALVPGTEHIACDPNSQSEIVVPVFDQEHNVIAVLDLDSTLPGSFDKIDQQYLEQLVSFL